MIFNSVKDDCFEYLLLTKLIVKCPLSVIFDSISLGREFMKVTYLDNLLKVTAKAPAVGLKMNALRGNKTAFFNP